MILNIFSELLLIVGISKDTALSLRQWFNESAVIALRKCAVHRRVVAESADYTATVGLPAAGPTLFTDALVWWAICFGLKLEDSFFLFSDSSVMWKFKHFNCNKSFGSENFRSQRDSSPLSLSLSLSLQTHLQGPDCYVCDGNKNPVSKHDEASVRKPLRTLQEYTGT